MRFSRERLLFYSAAGALGGLAAWGLEESVAGIHSYWLRAALLGLAIGLCIGGFLAAIDRLSFGQWRLAGRSALGGLGFGALGGAAGLLLGELLFDLLHGMTGRVVGWAVLGVLVGLSTGWASGSKLRWRNGALGGLLGGGVGGFFYQLLTSLFPQALGRAVAIVVLGALIGLFISLVGELLKRGWLMVVRSQSRNAREGREYDLVKTVTTIGRAEESDVGLFGDPAVNTRHAIIRREGSAFYLMPTAGSQVALNRQPVSGRRRLQSGDRLEVGGTLFVFRERAQKTEG
jgi:hypothetical protein